MSVILSRSIRRKAKRLPRLVGVKRCLANGGKLLLSKDIRSNYQPFGLQIVQPFRRFVRAAMIAHSLLSSLLARDTQDQSALVAGHAPHSLREQSAAVFRDRLEAA